MKKLTPTAEERQLGLDPNKYTRKQWNPADYFGWLKGGAPTAEERPSDTKGENPYAQQPIVDIKPEVIEWNPQTMDQLANELTDGRVMDMIKQQQSVLGNPYGGAISEEEKRQIKERMMRRLRGEE